MSQHGLIDEKHEFSMQKRTIPDWGFQDHEIDENQWSVGAEWTTGDQVH